jgi:hypothetical protein
VNADSGVKMITFVHFPESVFNIRKDFWTSLNYLP